MAVKILFEIGHEASMKPRTTPEGYTHDWELFVRGPDGCDITHFVDKVVFTLHESFPKPKRVIKEPPYVVKEQGYAGFILPIEIYFKNKGDEPKKKAFSYDLDLQSYKLQREECVITNPSDDFKRKLLKGGGTLLNSGMSAPASSGDYKRHGGSGEKSSSSQDKKYKKSSGDDPKVQNTFATLFGPPITKGSSKVSPDPAKQSSLTTKSSPIGGSSVGSSKTQQVNSKGDRSSSSSSKDKDKSEKDKSSKHKHSSPNKEKESKKSSSSDDKHSKEKKDKSHSKERDKTKDKSTGSSSSLSKRPLSPKRNSSATIPVPSMTNSPSTKRLPSPSVQPAAAVVPAVTSSSIKSEDKSSSKHSGDKEKKKEKKDKKNYDKEKDRSEKKDRDQKKDKEQEKSNSSTSDKQKSDIIKPSKLDAAKLEQKLYSKEKKLPEEPQKATHLEVPQLQQPATSAPTQELIKRVEKTDAKERDKEERKHKHKKKDKSKDKEKERSSSSKDKREKKDKEKLSSNKPSFPTPPAREIEPSVSPIKPAKLIDPTKSVHQEREAQPPPPAPKTVPINSLVEKHGADSSSDSEVDSPPSIIQDKDSENSNSSIADLIAARPPSAASSSSITKQLEPRHALEQAATVLEPPKPEKSHKNKKEKVKANSSESKDESKKRKRKNKEIDGEKEKDKKSSSTPTAAVIRRSPSPPTPPPTLMEPPAKIPKRDETYTKREESPASNNNNHSKMLPPEDIGTTSSYFNNNNASAVPIVSPAHLPPPTSSQPSNNTSSAAAMTAMTGLSGDYMSELKDLQHKIMTLQDNNELQRVVEMIAATGCYEITSATFDFDLCALDRHTVQRLQDFFATSCSS